MEIEKIRARIRAKQEMINIEDDQEKKNGLLQDLNILKMREEMEMTSSKIKKITSNK